MIINLGICHACLLQLSLHRRLGSEVKCVGQSLFVTGWKVLFCPWLFCQVLFAGEFIIRYYHEWDLSSWKCAVVCQVCYLDFRTLVLLTSVLLTIYLSASDVIPVFWLGLIGHLQINFVVYFHCIRRSVRCGRVGGIQQWLCVWCTGGNCEERTRVAEESVKEGKKNVSNSHEGIILSRRISMNRLPRLSLWLIWLSTWSWTCGGIWWPGSRLRRSEWWRACS